VPPPMPAFQIGRSMPRSRQSFVCIMASSSRGSLGAGSFAVSDL
jgi:hypothetical protein